ncbi:tRNA pseudouridine(38-40) synthase TruA [Arcanobacterium phocisimile]|uniref:tRNA pseudouridine synthase A n=1 Tax=Arcanobacterium phocisimile TaxID=1302235 RepID=A0ABX7IG30_9ACTO|nr:tRNA pseudouridine(38-40) synthase TruA [Arcanobacterium phocisimile]QRV01810.1 tRNA pseudouridine(38-40) synthase TruA [Arcanobacterium phocisimile]
MTSTLAQNIRLRLDLGYDGNHFHGWAAQPGLRTVQGELENVLSAIVRQPVVLTVAGRTDAGVHARHQVAHCDIPRESWLALPGRSSRTAAQSLVHRANSMLARSTGGVIVGAPKGFSDVVIHDVVPVSEEFDARFSALWRSYSYRIADGVACWDPQRRDVLWLADELDLEAMNRAVTGLLGEHNFLSYCKPREGASTVRTLHELSFTRVDGVVVGTARADAFCHSQVRTLMGTFIEVGRGRRGEEWPYQRLIEQNRDGQVVIAPPHPLTLERIGYPEPELYGVQAAQARRYRGG